MVTSPRHAAVTVATCPATTGAADDDDSDTRPRRVTETGTPADPQEVLGRSYAVVTVRVGSLATPRHTVRDRNTSPIDTAR